MMTVRLLVARVLAGPWPPVGTVQRGCPPLATPGTRRLTVTRLSEPDARSLRSGLPAVARVKTAIASPVPIARQVVPRCGVLPLASPARLRTAIEGASVRALPPTVRAGVRRHLPGLPVRATKVSMPHRTAACCNTLRLGLRVTPTSKADEEGCGAEHLMARVHNTVLRSLSEGVALLGEADLGESASEELRNAVRNLVGQLGPGRATTTVWREWPGAAALHLVMSGIYGYARGEYWAASLGDIGAGAAMYRQRWGRSFRLFLRLSGLPPFTGSGLPYVGPILGHAAIPNDCLADFFGSLLEPAITSEHWAGLSADELIREWLSSPALLSLVDRPIEAFLREGGRTAQEFVDQCAAMARARHETGDVPPADELRLPRRVVEAYARWVAEEGQGRFPEKLRRPVLRLDPHAEVYLDLREQVLPLHHAGMMAVWSVSAAGQPQRPIRRVPRDHGHCSLLAAEECAVPPIGPYDVELRVGSQRVAQWSLCGLESGPPLRAFSDGSMAELDCVRLLPRRPTWLVAPANASLSVRDMHGEELAADPSAYLSGEWMGYAAHLVDLTHVRQVILSQGELVYRRDVEGGAPAPFLRGGDLLESAEVSSDGVPLYGDEPPSVVIPGVHGIDASTEDTLAVCIGGWGTKGGMADTTLPSEQLRGALGECPEGVVLDLRMAATPALCPGAIHVRIWRGRRRMPALWLRWVPGLAWRWAESGRAVQITLPNGVAARCPTSSPAQQLLRDHGDFLEASFPPDDNEVDLVLSWPQEAGHILDVPLRLRAPRWAFVADLDRSLCGSVWQVRAIELQPRQLTEGNPALLFEARDEAWRSAYLRAVLSLGDGGLEQELRVEASRRIGRWLVRLAPAADTIRHYASSTCEVRLHATIGSVPSRVVEISLLTARPLAPPTPPPKWPGPEGKPEPLARAEEPELVRLGKEILCCLTHWFWAPLDLIAEEVNAPTEMVRRAIRSIQTEHVVLVQENALALPAWEYRRLQLELREWFAIHHE